MKFLIMLKLSQTENILTQVVKILYKIYEYVILKAKLNRELITLNKEY